MTRKRKHYYKRGKYYYFRIGGKRGSLDCTTEAEAKRLVADLLQRFRDKKLGIMDPSQARLGEFRKAYQEHREGLRLSAGTIRRDGQALRSLAKAIGGDCLLRNIRQRKIDQWTAKLLSGGLQPTTINSYLRHIRAAFSTAAEWDLLDSPPRLKGPREPSRLPRALTKEEMDTILAKEENPERKAAWRFLLWTGLRRQEFCDLRWENVHADGEEPWIRVIGKGDKEGLVPLLPEAAEALKTMPRSDVGLVWRFELKGRRRAIHPDTLSHWFKEAARRAGITDAHLHDLRHTCATWLAAHGVPERILQEILRHASITTTQIYTKGLARVANLYKETDRHLK